MYALTPPTFPLSSFLLLYNKAMLHDRIYYQQDLDRLHNFLKPIALPAIPVPQNYRTPSLYQSHAFIRLVRCLTPKSIENFKDYNELIRQTEYKVLISLKEIAEL